MCQWEKQERCWQLHQRLTADASLAWSALLANQGGSLEKSQEGSQGSVYSASQEHPTTLCQVASQTDCPSNQSETHLCFAHHIHVAKTEDSRRRDQDATARASTSLLWPCQEACSCQRRKAAAALERRKWATAASSWATCSARLSTKQRQVCHAAASLTFSRRPTAAASTAFFCCRIDMKSCQAAHTAWSCWFLKAATALPRLKALRAHCLWRDCHALHAQTKPTSCVMAH